MTIIYYTTLIIICLMIYDLAYNRNNRKEGFKHRGGEILPTPKVSEDTYTPSITMNTISGSYNTFEGLTKMILMIPYNIIRPIVNIIKSFTDYLFDILDVFSYMFNSLIKSMWSAMKKLFYIFIEFLKNKIIENIMNLPANMKNFFDSGFSRTVASIMSFINSIIIRMFEIPKQFF